MSDFSTPALPALDAITTNTQTNVCISPDDFIIKRNFMFHKTGLGLTGTKCDVYALIYAYSIDNAGCYYGGIKYITDRFCINERNAKKILSELKNEQLIIETGNYHDGDHCPKCYKANLEVAEQAKTRFINAQIPINQVENTNTCTSVTEDTRGGVTKDTPYNKYNKLNNNNGVNTLQVKTNTQPKSDQPIATDSKPPVDLFNFSKTNREAFETLCELSPKKQGNKYAPRPFHQRILDGYTPDEIVAAWKYRLRELEDAQLPTTYYPKLENWLANSAAHTCQNDVATIRSHTKSAEIRAAREREQREEKNRKTILEILEELAARGDPEAQTLNEQQARALRALQTEAKAQLNSHGNNETKLNAAQTNYGQVVEKIEQFIAQHAA